MLVSQQRGKDQATFSNQELSKKISEGSSVLAIMRGGNCQSLTQAQASAQQKASETSRSCKTVTRKSETEQEYGNVKENSERKAQKDQEEAEALFKDLNRRMQKEE